MSPEVDDNIDTFRLVQILASTIRDFRGTIKVSDNHGSAVKGLERAQNSDYERYSQRPPAYLLVSHVPLVMLIYYFNVKSISP